MISNNNKKTTKQTTPWHIWYNTQDEAYESTAKPQRKNELITRACHIMAPTLPHDHWPAERPNPKEKQRFPANKRADTADGENTAIQINPKNLLGHAEWDLLDQWLLKPGVQTGMLKAEQDCTNIAQNINHAKI